MPQQQAFVGRMTFFSLVCAVVMALATPAQRTSVKLNNGVDMPVLAFGANVWDADTCKAATTAALQATTTIVLMCCDWRTEIQSPVPCVGWIQVHLVVGSYWRRLPKGSGYARQRAVERR